MTGRIVIGVIYGCVDNVQFHVLAKDEGGRFFTREKSGQFIYLQEIAVFHDACFERSRFLDNSFYKYRQYVQLSIGIDKTFNNNFFKKI